MTGFLGMVPTEVDALANALRRKADEVDQLTQSITGRLEGTSWAGADRTAFEQQWSGELANGLRQLSQTLRDTGEVAAANAQQQRDVSGS